MEKTHTQKMTTEEWIISTYIHPYDKVIAICEREDLASPSQVCRILKHLVRGAN